MVLNGADGYVIRRMERPELDTALEWAKAEGWNPGQRDAECFWAADPCGYFVGLLEGRLIACISAVGYSSDEVIGGKAPAFGFIGLYLVRPEMRGRGYGLRLWNAALAQIHAPVLGLDGVPAQQENYRKSGFALALRNCRYQGMSDAVGMRGSGATLPGVRPLELFPFGEVLELDRRCFPARREEFVRAWVSAPGHVALGLERAGRLAGYGVIRPCAVGHKIGPLFAQDDDAAHDLFHSLCASIPATSGPVFLDVPMSHAGAVALAEAHAMRPVFETARMYRGPAPDSDLGRVFGVSTFELG